MPKKQYRVSWIMKEVNHKWEITPESDRLVTTHMQIRDVVHDEDGNV